RYLPSICLERCPVDHLLLHSFAIYQTHFLCQVHLSFFLLQLPRFHTLLFLGGGIFNPLPFPIIIFKFRLCLIWYYNLNCILTLLHLKAFFLPELITANCLCTTKLILNKCCIT